MRQSYSQLTAMMWIALMLSLIPFPHIFLGARPPFVLIAILYIQFYAPSLLRMSWLLIVSVLLDMLVGTVFGEHGLAFAMVCWMASTKARRFHLFSMGQQMGLMALFGVLYASMIALVEACCGHPLSLISIPFTGCLTVFCWPWVRLMRTRLIF